MSANHIKYQIHFNRDYEFSWFRWALVEAVVYPGPKPENLVPNQKETVIPQVQTLQCIKENTRDDRDSFFVPEDERQAILDYKLQHKDKSLLTTEELEKAEQEGRGLDYWVYDGNESILRVSDAEELAEERYNEFGDGFDEELDEEFTKETDSDQDDHDEAAVDAEKSAGVDNAIDPVRSTTIKVSSIDATTSSTNKRKRDSSESFAAAAAQERAPDPPTFTVRTSTDDKIHYRIVDTEDYPHELACSSTSPANQDRLGLGKKIGSVVGRVIRRNAIRPDFWEEMESAVQDTADLAFAVFDRHGFVQRFHIKGSTCGSGAWGRELDDGNILLVETVRVDTAHRRRGIARKLIDTLIANCARKDIGLRFVFAESCWLREEVRDEMDEDEAKTLRGRILQRNTNLLRNVGFRRVGWSYWLARAVDRNHDSHRLSSEQDADRPDKSQQSELQLFEKHLEKSRSSREQGMAKIVTSDKFVGYSDDDVKRLLQLRGIEPSATSPALIARTKFGCSCELCYCGFISPRMRYLLNSAALESRDHLDEDARWLFDEDTFCHISDKHLRARMMTNKGFRQAYRDLCEAFATTMESNTPPNPLNVGVGIARDFTDSMISQWPPHIRNFLDAGGSIKPIIKAVIEYAELQDPQIGSESMIPEFHLEQMKDMPECRNDREYAMVLRNLIIKRRNDGSISPEETFRDLTLYPEKEQLSVRRFGYNCAMQ